MSKSTTAVLLVSPASSSPWGDDDWRFTGAMQLVQDGPDFLHAQWTTPGVDLAAPSDRRVSMVLRDEPHERAQDIAVMALLLLGVDDGEALDGWWDGIETRPALQKELAALLAPHAGNVKLAVVETATGSVDEALRKALEKLGLIVRPFAEVERSRSEQADSPA